MYLVVAGAGAVSHALWARDIYSNLSRFLAWVLLVVLLRTVQAFLKRGLAVVPIVPMIVLQYYVLYGAAQFSQTAMRVMGSPYVPRQESVEKAMLLAVGACVAFTGGAIFARKWLGSDASRLWNVLPEPNDRWRTPVAVYATVSAIFSYFATMAPEYVPVAIRNAVTVGLNPYLGLALVLFLLHRNGGPILRVLAICMVVLFGAITATTSMLEPVIVAMYVVFVAAWLWGPGIRLRWALVGASLFLLLNPAKYTMRQSNRGQASGGPTEVLANWQSSLVSVWMSTDDVSGTAELATARVSGIIALAQGVEWIPSVTPHQHGSGFGKALLYFVPRVFWPDKPGSSDLINNRYALAFGLSTEEGLRTSTFGILQPLDGYWDFGYGGALAYSVAFGTFIGWGFRERKGARVAEAVVALIFSSWFFQSLAAVQVVLASLVSLFVGTWIVLRSLDFFSANGPERARTGRRHSVGGRRTT